MVGDGDAPQVEVRVLGPVDIFLAGQPMRLPRLSRSLVAHLAADAGRVVSVDRLVAALWPGQPPTSARNRIQVMISKVRSALAQSAITADVLTTAAPGYRLDATRLDSSRFASLVEQGRLALASGAALDATRLIRQALGLWRGAAFEGIVGDSLAAERARWEELRLAAYELCLTTEVAAGRHHQLVAELTALVTEHPLRERLREQLMICLYRGGREADALAVYRQGYQLSVEELGVPPCPQLQTLHHAILNRHPSLDLPPSGPTVPTVLARTTPAQLPMSVPDFTGRTSESRWLHDVLVERTGRPADTPAVAVISGMGGVGKTTLAVRSAAAVTRAFPDGCLFADLRGTGPAPGDPHLILGFFLRALGVASEAVPSHPEERLATYRSVTSVASVLVLLDDAADEAQVRPLLPTGPRSAAVVTSRASLLGLDGAARLPLEVLSTEQGTALLAAVAGRDRVANAVDAQRLVRLCGGLPLALRIAGARLHGQRGLTLRQLVERLSRESDQLDELSAGDRSVRACLSLSYRPLPRESATLFHLLGTAPGDDFTARTCAAILGCSLAEAGRPLDLLRRAALVAGIDPGSDGSPRYRLHELVRRFAAERAAGHEPPDHRDDALRRLVEHYTDTAAATTSLLTGGRHEDTVALDLTEPLRFTDAVEAIDWFQAEKHNLRAVVQQAAARGWHAQTWRLAYSLRACYRRCSDFDDWLVTHELALDAARLSADRVAEVRIRESLGAACLELGRLAEAEDHWIRTLTMLAELGDEIGLGRSHDSLGTLYARRRDFEAALAHHHAALALPAYAAHPQYAAMAQVNLGAVYGELGRFGQARQAFHRALAVAQEFGDSHVACLAEHNLAEVMLLTGDHERAQTHARREITLAQEVRFPFREARGWEMLGDCLSGSDEAEARAAFEHAVDLYERLDHPYRSRVRQKLADRAVATR